MVSAQDALRHLQTGNQRFVSGVSDRSTHTDQTRRSEMIAGQEPLAIVLGCSDSRVPAEINFDQGLGDLFVVRVAGNIVASSQIGSIEFAAERFGARLVVVLGHSDCTAVQTALEQVERPSESRSPYLDTIVDLVRRTLRSLLELDSWQERGDLMREAVRANIRASMSHLRFGSNILGQMIDEDGLLIVGAEYSLRTGVVHFFDDLLETQE